MAIWQTSGSEHHSVGVPINGSLFRLILAIDFWVEASCYLSGAADSETCSQKPTLDVKFGFALDTRV
jgi:hypothetical protein